MREGGDGVRGGGEGWEKDRERVSEEGGMDGWREEERMGG